MIYTMNKNSFYLASPDAIFGTFQELSLNKLIGTDEIPPRILKETADVLTQHL